MDFSEEKKRERCILAGLYLSKFDKAGLKRLFFSGFHEAFNVLGYALGAQPASIKNYRDEFDPLFPNDRKGWHGRPTRKYCVEILNRYRALDIEAFAALITSFMQGGENLPDAQDDTSNTFAQRLATGLAAENYFEAMYPAIPEFSEFALENTTRLGCGFDYKLTHKKRETWLAVEVKGMLVARGGISLTELEYNTAKELKNDYYLFVVKNFREKPNHTFYKNPLLANLSFLRKERVVVQISWTATI